MGVVDSAEGLLQEPPALEARFDPPVLALDALAVVGKRFWETQWIMHFTDGAHLVHDNTYTAEDGSVLQLGSVAI